jgi:hypothetical protein
VSGRRPLGAALLLLLALGAGCRARAEQSPALVAKFGIFFGGQVQERNELPLEADRTRQSQGIRIDMDPPPSEPLEVRWELSLPAGKRTLDGQGRKAPGRRTRSGHVSMRPGEPRLEQVLPFAVDDPLGLWNIRVLVADRVVIDRPFVVYDAREREQARALHEAAPDGGP